MNEDDKIYIKPAPIMTPTENDLILMERGWSPIRYMTRDEVEKKYQEPNPGN